MKTIALSLFAAALGLAQSQSGATAPAPKDAAKPAAPVQKSAAQNKKPTQPSKPSPDQKVKAQAQTQSIPAGATAVEPNLYRYTDSNGKTWNYRQTPFGISKWEESSAPAQQPAPAKNEPVVVTDLGDSYRFEKKTPFGESTWVRKKSELTDEERALAGDRQASSESNRTNVDSKPAGNQ
ncbi:MAG: hypothetical protein ABSG13_00145 [Bryobacteraceae bacterium]|jgi:hypothetical protein